MARLTVADVPHMLKMWDHELNTEKPEKVPANCTTKKYWKCPDCGYHWSTSPKARYRCSGKCPCHESNKVICKGVNDIITLVKGLDAFLDENNNFEEIYGQGTNSSLFVNFKCDECGRKWTAMLRSQVKKGVNGGYIATGCPHYNTLKRNESNVPFCSDVDGIFKFWDDKNPLNPTTTKSNSTERVHFICKKCGYDWNTTIVNQAKGLGKCKCCELQKVTRKGFTDVFSLIPDSKRYFNFEKNKDIDIYSIPLRNTNIQIDWKCPDCSYEWRSPLASRINGTKSNYSFIGCKHCSQNEKNRITPVASFPKLLKYWDFKKNKENDLDPNLISAYADISAHWRCKDCGYEWVVNIKTRRTSNGTCPFCDRTRKPIMKGKNDILTLCEEFGEIYDFEKNEKEGIDIYKIGVGSKTEAHFKCKKCGHQWDSQISKRIRKNPDGTYKLADCPKCSHGRFRKTPYSEQYPLLSKMYREDINKISLDSIRGAKTSDVYYWDCPDCKETFESTLNSMINSYKTSTHGCSYCSRTKLRKGESFAELHPELMDEYDPTNNFNPYEVFPTCKDYAKWICRDCGHQWSTTFALRHDGWGNCPLCNRTALIPDKNSFAAVYPDLVKYWADSNDRKADEVFYNSKSWFLFICPTCNEEHSSVIEKFISKNSCLVCKKIKLSPKKNSLKAKYPDIARRWSPNNESGADTIFPTSWEWFKWICDTCTGEYTARARDVVNGTDQCPYCNGTKVLPGFNSFADKHQDLLDEMDEIANYLLPKSPYDVFDTSTYKFWWICKRNPEHKYPMSPRNRLMFQKRHREPCLYCRGLRRKLNHFVLFDKKL